MLPPAAKEDQSTAPAIEARAVNRPLMMVLLAIGFALFAFCFDPEKLTRYWVALGVAGVMVCMPALRLRASVLIDRLRAPTRAQKWATFAILFLLCGWYFLLSAMLTGRDFIPKFHDEYMYLLQARMLASGRLWLPAHELAPFFESFHILVEPVYAATYFPGAAMLYVPGVWLGAPYWVTSAIISGLAVAMLYPVMTELFDGVSGLLAVLMAIALHFMREGAITAESYQPMMLLVLLAAWCHLRWRERRSYGWAAAFGVCAGWAAITRPLDAVCFVGPICVLFAWDTLRGEGRGRRAFVTFAIVTAAALPFLALQLVFDEHVTGHYLETPLGHYVRTTFPGLEFRYTPATAPAEAVSDLAQVREYYADFFRKDVIRHATIPFAQTWLSERLATVADITLPAHATFVLLPVGLLCLRRHGTRAALAAGVLTMPLAYSFYPSFLNLYGIACIPAFQTLCLGGEHVLRRTLPRTFTSAVALALAALSLASLPQLRGERDRYMQTPLLADVNDKLAHLPHVPAVVLFHYDPGGLYHEEPVYNIDTANPDDAPIVRAHDLGPENWRIVQYYARHQPDRFFYLYNRTTTELTPLGPVNELAARFPAPK